MSTNVPARDPNAHVQQYLEYYVSMPVEPHYAVMLRGPWGIGKTYLIERLLDKMFGQQSSIAALKDVALKAGAAAAQVARSAMSGGAGKESKSPTEPPPSRRYVYVSLYGVSTPKEIDEAILRQMYPALGTSTAKVAGRVLSAAMTAFKLPKLELSDVMGRYEVDLYVFDDLERCKMPVDAALGYINEFVEHAGNKVVVVANEDEIKQVGYEAIREKVIGKTLTMLPATEEALDFFISQLADGDVKTLITAQREFVANIYRRSAVNNLRILQRSIWDTARVLDALTSRHKQNVFGVQAVMQLLLAWSFERRSGRLSASTLFPRSDDMIARMSLKKGDEPTERMKADKRYDFDLSDTVLTDDILRDVLENGVINQEAIREHLDRTPYYVDRKKEPAWHALWHGVTRHEDEVEAAIAAVEGQFAKRSVTSVGEMLQIFGLRIMLAGIGAISSSRAEVVVEGKKYIDDLLEGGSLEPQTANAPDPWGLPAYQGLVAMEAESSEMKELQKYLFDKRVEADLRLHPKLAAGLLDEMKSDPGLFIRRITPHSGGHSEYARVPILAAMKPADFVSTLLGLSPGDQRFVLFGLRDRYANGEITSALAGERKWLQDVEAALVDAASKMKPYARWRVSSLVRVQLTPILQPVV